MIGSVPDIRRIARSIVQCGGSDAIGENTCGNSAAHVMSRASSVVYLSGCPASRRLAVAVYCGGISSLTRERSPLVKWNK